MVVNGSKVYLEGVEPSSQLEAQLSSLTGIVKSYAPESDLSVKLIKVGRTCEILAWGRAGDIPIGVYRRGSSVEQSLKAASDGLRRQALRIWRGRHGSGSPSGLPLAEAMAS
ncbi:MAG: hypothetical protein AB7F86_06175 [Bdellovibrionales bacterium]